MVSGAVMQDTHEKTFTYDELDKRAKAEAHSQHSQHTAAFEFESYADTTIEQAKEEGLALGFDIYNVYYSGFWSQGDGAAWEGRIDMRRWVDYQLQQYDAKGEAPPVWMMVMQALLQEDLFEAYASVRTRRHNNMYLTDWAPEVAGAGDEVLERSIFSGANACELWEAVKPDDLEKILLDDAVDYADKIYRDLEAEYDYQTSEEVFIELCEANSWRFDEDGNFAI